MNSHRASLTAGNDTINKSDYYVRAKGVTKGLARMPHGAAIAKNIRDIFIGLPCQLAMTAHAALAGIRIVQDRKSVV
jgi:hypothetical protein